MKRIISILSLIIGFRLLADIESANGYTWRYRVSGNSAEIYLGDSLPAISPKPTGYVNIPTTLGGKMVTRIGASAFYGCGGLTRVTIPASVTSIGNDAFRMCNGLTSITIPNNVANIGESAFEDCLGLTSVTIPNSVTNIEKSAFASCWKLTSVSIPDSVTSIGDYSFYGCTRLVNLVLGNSVANIGSNAFGCSYVLASLEIPNSLTNIGEHAFYKGSITNFTVCSGNPRYSSANGCLLSKDGKTLILGVNGNVSVPDSVVSIGDESFASCDGLTSVTIPNSVTNIGARAFSGCKKLTNISIGDSVTCIGRNAFDGCVGLMDGDGFVIGCNVLLVYCGSKSVVTIPNTVAIIGAGAFQDCNGIISVTIGESVTNIGAYAFSACGGLTSITIPNSVLSIGDYAFRGCSELESFEVASDNANYSSAGGLLLSKDGSTLISGVKAFVAMPESLKNIEPSAFYDCRGLASITIPNGVTNIGDEAFRGCSGLASAVIGDSVTNIGVKAFMGCTNLTNVAIPDGVVSIGPSAFYNCRGLVSVAMPSSVTSIGDLAFYGCSGLKIVYLSNDYKGSMDVFPPGVTLVRYKPNPTVSLDANGGYVMPSSLIVKWGAEYETLPRPFRDGYTFAGWTYNGQSISNDTVVSPIGDHILIARWSMSDITVSSGVSKIKDIYSNDYQYATNIVISASVASLSDNFFDGCDALENVTFVSPDTELGNNDLRRVGKLFANQPDGYWIVQGVLLGYKGVCPRVIPDLDSVKRVMGGALEGCTALEELNFTTASVLTTIETNAFKQCTELRQMTLPPSLTEIGGEAFMGCSYLGNVIVPGSVRNVGDRAFKNCTGFTAAQIEYGVESLGEEAFCGDWRISEVDIPSTVTNIGVNAFGGDSSIIRIGLRGDVRKASEIFSNYKFIREATVKEGTGEVVDGLFSGFEKLRDVRFFGNCPSLENDGQLLYAMTPGKSDDNAGLTTFVEANSTGWDGTPGSHSLPQAWPLGGGSRRAIAYWDVPSYLCQFESNGGTLGVQDTYQYSEKPFALPPEPVQSGYKFAGWWTKPVGGLPVTKDTIFIEGVYTMLYAHWIKGHWVFLDPNGGTVVNDYVTYVEETTYGVLPSPVRSGYAFNGWLYNDIVIEPTTVIGDKNDHTIVAQWTANVYSVRYHANGGIGNMEDESRTYGTEKALRKNVFINNGYVFSGWATNETSSVIYSDCETVSNMTAVANGWIDLYAVWEESDVMPDPSNLEFHFSGDAMWTRCSEGVEVEKDGETLRYDSVWKSGGITDNQTSVLMANVYGAGKIGYWWKVSCEPFRNLKLDYLEFAIDDVPQEPWINGVTDWQYLEFEVNETGPHTLSWTYKKDGEGDEGEDCGRVVAAVWTPSLVTLGDYVNCPRFEFRTSGGAEWAGDRQISHDGIASLRSGKIDHNGTTVVELDVMGEGRIGFWWKVSSEEFRQLKIDYVSFKIDGIEQAWIGGEVDWTNVAFNVVGDGTHTLSWEYHKDSEGSAGEDCAWLDEVIWMPSGGTIPELTPAQAAAWVSNDLAARYAKSGESAADYQNRFEAKFGSDLVAAMSMPTDKKDAQGNNMYVWQDYVAGTDPTDTNSVFTATITMVDGEPVVEWSPKLGVAEESRRRYTIYGKAGLGAGEEWHSPTNVLDRFFTVGVEMK